MEPVSEEMANEWAQVLTNAAWYMWKKGTYAAARDALARAVTVRGRTVGRDVSISLMAGVLQDQGKYEEAVVYAAFMRMVARERRSTRLRRKLLSNLSTIITFGLFGPERDVGDLIDLLPSPDLPLIVHPNGTVYDGNSFLPLL